MLKQNFWFFLCLLLIWQEVNAKAQLGSLRKFSISFYTKSPVKSNIMNNMIKKQREEEQKLKEAQRNKQEELENKRRKIIEDYLLKRMAGNGAVLKDFFSRF
jgi:hypothetical protein